MKRKLWIIPIGIGAVIIFAWLGGTIVKLLWNWLMPELFGLPQLDFWKALGLLALSRILFGSFGKGGGGHRREWGRMSPEERERFRARMRGGCGPDSGEKAPETPAAN